MGRFSVDVEVANFRDVVLAEAGSLPADQVRRARVSGVVDSGATRLVLPEPIAKALGLEDRGPIGVRFADGRRDQRRLVGGAQVTILGRRSEFDAVVEPGRSDALIGAIVLEALDFIVDCAAQKLVPRDPDMIVAEIE